LLLVPGSPTFWPAPGRPAGPWPDWDRRPSGWNPGGSLDLSAGVAVHPGAAVRIWVVLFGFEAWWPSPAEAYCRFVVVLKTALTRPPMAGATGGGHALATGVADRLVRRAACRLDFINRAGIRQVVGGRRVDHFRVALAIFVVLFFSTGLPPPPVPPADLFAPMLRWRCPWPGRRRSDRAVGRSGPSTVVFCRHGGLQMAACARNRMTASFPHLRSLHSGSVESSNR